MSNPNFKQEFENSLQRLAQINDAIDANLKSKQEFSARIIQRLSAINDKVKQLGDAIKTLKDELTNLQAQAATNNTHIENIGTEVSSLKTQILQLTDERNKAIAELDQLKKQYQTDIQDFQKRIDDCEEKLRQLTEQNVQITQQRDALDAELKKTGDVGTAHADELKKMSDQHAQELQQKDEQLRLQQDANNAKIKQLQDEIAVKEAELNKTIADVGNNASQLQEQIVTLNKEKEEKENQIAQLQAQITALQNENQDLVNRIIAATQAIADATNRLQELNDPAAFNETELDAKFQELEASVQQISNAIQGNPLANNETSLQPMPGQNRFPSDTQILLNGQNLTLQQIILQLKNKPQKDRNTGGPSKYALALSAVYKAQTAEEVVQALQSLNVGAKNGSIYGGKKTKKHRKQKGGYTYKLNSKRRSISSRSSSKRKSDTTTSITGTRRHSKRR
jgi:chromosome segregation ATPase